MNILKSVIVSLALLTVLSGCALFGGDPSDGDLIYGEALVDSISIEILESFPVQVRVVAVGNLQDACTGVSSVDVMKSGNTFDVSIKTSRPADMSCAQVLTPFEESFMLDVYGLPAGNYVVDVNGVTESFELEVDNAPPGNQ